MSTVFFITNTRQQCSSRQFSNARAWLWQGRQIFCCPTAPPLSRSVIDTLRNSRPFSCLFYACIPQKSILSAHPVPDLLRSCRCSAKIHSGVFEKSICSCKIVTVHVFLSDIESSSGADLFRSLFPFQLCLCIASLPFCPWIKWKSVNRNAKSEVFNKKAVHKAR